MNTLLELNGYGSTGVQYIDNRPAGIIYDRSNPNNQSLNIYQHDTHYVPVGIQVLEIIDPNTTGASYTIDIHNSSGATLTWTNPNGLTTTNPGTGIYKILFNSAADWQTIRSPLITLDITYNGTFTYTATITDIQGQTKSWTVTVVVNPVITMTDPTANYFSAGGTGLVTGNPVIVDSLSTNWQAVITPSSTSLITTLSSGGAGGTVTFNNTSKVLTIIGTKAQVNQHLGNIGYVVPSTSKTDFTLTYTITSTSNSNIGDTKVQNWYSLEYLGQTRTPNINYHVGTTFNITGGPLITDYSSDGSGTYYMLISTDSQYNVLNMTSTGHQQYDQIDKLYNLSPSYSYPWIGSAAFSGDGTWLATTSGFYGDSGATQSIDLYIVDPDLGTIYSSSITTVHGTLYLNDNGTKLYNIIQGESSTITGSTTGTDAGNVIKITGSGLEVGMAIYFNATFAGIVSGTIYYINGIGSGDITISEIPGGSTKIITAATSGNHLWSAKKPSGVYQYSRSGTTWTLSNTYTLAYQNVSFDCSADGTIFAASQPYPTLNADVNPPAAGYVIIHSPTSAQNTTITYGKPAQSFGKKVKLSDDGSRLASSMYGDVIVNKFTTMTNNVITSTGSDGFGASNAYVGTAPKFGSTSLKFNNLPNNNGATVTCFLTIPNDYYVQANGENYHTNGGIFTYSFTGDFTVEAWISTRGISSYGSGTGNLLQTIFNFDIGSLYIDITNHYIFDIGSASIVANDITSTSDWTHIALNRDSGTIKLYINGTQHGNSINSTSTFTFQQFGAGKTYDSGTISNSNYWGSGGGFVGYMDEIRISNGISRYPNNFTAPSNTFGMDQWTIFLSHCEEQANATDHTTLNYQGFGVGGTTVIHHFDGTTWNYQTTLSGGLDYLNFNTSGNKLYCTTITNDTQITNVYAWNGTNWNYSSSLPFAIQKINGSETWAIDNLANVYHNYSSAGWLPNNQLIQTQSTDVNNVTTTIGEVWNMSRNGNYVICIATTEAITGHTYTGAAYVFQLQSHVGSIYDPSTTTLTLSGSRQDINDDIDTITMTVSDYSESTITLTYTMQTPAGRFHTESRTQTLSYIP